MRHSIWIAAAVAAVAMSGFTMTAHAQSSSGPNVSQHPQSGYYRGQSATGGTGGYSYVYTDGLIDSRDTSVFLDPEMDERAIDPGPFGTDFFFESGVGGAIDASPYP